jgi:hypothetical protein
MAKLVIFLMLFVGSMSACGDNKVSQFMPDNDLWKSDCLNCKSNVMTQELFQKIVDAGKVAYASNAAANNEILVINALWSNKTVNANCGRSSGKVTVTMYGGLARRPEITAEGFALVLGHELNHAYGGTPYYPSTNNLSAEGQSDFMATKDAYAKIAKLVPELNEDIPVTDFIANICSNKDYKNCIHSLYGGQSLGNLLAVLNKHPQPNYETPDMLQVEQTLSSYPATTQCRLDSYLAGTINAPRPACWYKEGTLPAFIKFW